MSDFWRLVFEGPSKETAERFEETAAKQLPAVATVSRHGEVVYVYAESEQAAEPEK